MMDTGIMVSSTAMWIFMSESSGIDGFASIVLVDMVSEWLL